MFPTPAELDKLIDLALAEDAASADVTTNSIIPPHLLATASVVVKEDGIVSGIAVAEAVFKRVDPNLKFSRKLLDGDSVEAGTAVATVSGSMGSILTAERTALNFMQRMSGIASLTRQYVDAVEGTTASITDTRKTVPGLRLLDKYAVTTGGGRNHRLNLADGVLIKDNHLAALQEEGFMLAQVIKQARAKAPHTVKIEVEVESEDAALAAADAGADIVMLDNMDAETMRRIVDQIAMKCTVEASGGINLESVRDAARAGVDIISIGALTHSPPALDISLDYSR